MHRGHDHHHHDHGHGHHGHAHHPQPGSVGHNAPAPKTAQWQTPHLPHGHEPRAEETRTVDIDLVETAFQEGFGRAPDPVSFLRLAGIPFVGETADGGRLHLLRVETEDVVDVGAVMPVLGGQAVRYDPLPAKLTSRRRRLGFLYHDGTATRRLTFAEARSLHDRTGAACIDVTGH